MYFKRDFVSLIFAYSLILSLIFIHYISVDWSYFGINLKTNWNIGDLILISFLSVVPLIFLKNRQNDIAILLLIIVYMYAYIPMLVGLGLDGGLQTSDYFISMIGLFFGMVIAINIQNYFSFKILRSRRVEFPVNNFKVLKLTCFIMLSYIVFRYWDVMSFKSPVGDSVYEQRFFSRDFGKGDLFTDYFIMWLSGALLPLIMSFGLYRGRTIDFIFGAMGMVILYSVGANKGYLLSIFFILIIFILNNGVGFLSRLIKSTLFTAFFILVLFIFFRFNLKTEFLFFNIFMALFTLRFLMISSINVINYSIFFTNNPHTYFTHINILKKYSGLYPYGSLDLGQAVGLELFGNQDSNINSNFFIMDGLSSLGNYGFLAAGVLFGMLLILVRLLVSKHDFKFLAPLFALTGIGLCNVSMFTTLNSGGTLILLLILFFTKPIVYHTK